MLNITIQPDKQYSVREAAKCLGWTHSLPTFQKIVRKDFDEKNNIFKAIVLKRNKRKRYYINGKNLILFQNRKDYKQIIENGRMF
ncbi:MAG: hypothetical protein WC438_05515 [Candidatus Pacearchaeota archaeon]